MLLFFLKITGHYNTINGVLLRMTLKLGDVRRYAACALAESCVGTFGCFLPVTQVGWTLDAVLFTI